jgi:imidazoleglycerol-phosphate dehydratase
VPNRVASRTRITKETQISIELDLDGTGEHEISTGIPFYDHMLAQLAKHGGIDMNIKAVGDIHIDTHHTVEDTGILLGEAFREALGDKAGVRRFASIAVPLDEALIDVAVDLSGRPFLAYNVDFSQASPNLLGTPGFDPQLGEHFWQSFAHAAHITLHIRSVSGTNTHHILEASFKGVARAIRDAIRVEGSVIPSTKGTLNATSE